MNRSEGWDPAQWRLTLQGLAEGAMVEDASKEASPARLTPKQAGARIFAKGQYEIARLEADFMQQIRDASPDDYLGLIEEHCVDRFNVWAVACACLACSGESVVIDRGYVQLLESFKRRVVRELSRMTASIHPDWQDHVRERVELRLAIEMKRCIADVGLAILDRSAAPLVVEAEVEAPTAAADADGLGSRDTEREARRQAIRDYKHAYRKKFGKNLTDVMIAEAADKNWHTRTQVGRWKGCDPRITPADDAKIRSVLRRKPHLA